MERNYSATEVNKFCYCRLQWYYGRTYGAKYINELRKERNAGYEPPGGSHFQRGTKFHRNYIRNIAIRRVAACAAILAVIVLLAVLKP